MTRPAFKDAELAGELDLPNGAATVIGAEIPVGNNSTGDFTALMELLLTAPALVVGDLANGSTMKYSIVTENADTLYAPTVLLRDVITQTGAGGAGAAAATWQGRLPVGGVLRTVGLQIVNSASGDASDKTATLEAVF